MEQQGAIAKCKKQLLRRQYDVSVAFEKDGQPVAHLKIVSVPGPSVREGLPTGPVQRATEGDGCVWLYCPNSWEAGAVYRCTQGDVEFQTPLGALLGHDLMEQQDMREEQQEEFLQLQQLARADFAKPGQQHWYLVRGVTADKVQRAGCLRVDWQTARVVDRDDGCLRTVTGAAEAEWEDEASPNVCFRCDQLYANLPSVTG